MKLEDLVKWVHSDFSKWRCGLHTGSVKTAALGRNGQKEALLKYRQSTLNSGLNFKDILKEKADLGKYNLHFQIACVGVYSNLLFFFFFLVIDLSGNPVI